jgi:mono/diheme cytochrome c family protein
MKRKILILSLIALAMPVAASAATGEELWARYCKMCHGADGAGQTAMGKRLQVGDYTDPAVVAAITDEAAREAIINGKKSESGKQTMLPFGKKLSSEEIDLLIAYLRTLPKT